MVEKHDGLPCPWNGEVKPGDGVSPIGFTVRAAGLIPLHIVFHKKRSIFL